jgi:hypothetical protein
MHALRVWVAGIVLVATGLVSCGGEQAPWLRNAGDVNTCERITCPAGMHCEPNGGAGPGTCAPDRPTRP